MVDSLESRRAPGAKKVRPLSLEIAIAKNTYFVCVKGKINSAGDAIRVRCERFHGLLVSAALDKTYVNSKGEDVKYRPSDAMYDLKRG
jgi:hypothetical protein